ncbi:Gfo/Idh/MocA family protein [uncultured Fibrella sp.]|uniref:Gfo/Idh/MocA family protein n=1 Tax=uncultured Fibrella sp. TaxID=1284596 RepID=UPI0035CB98C2
MKYALLLLSLIYAQFAQAQTTPKPLRVGIAGLTHAHVHQILGRLKQGDLVLVGIAEANRDLATRLTKQYGIDMALVYPTLDEMLSKGKPEAVLDFGSIAGHVNTVKTCAPKGIHVMVEKPLATRYSDAVEMAALSRKHNTQLLTNYETTWYGSNHRAYAVANTDKAIGDIRKIVVHDGHKGPKEIGCNPEFLAWLTDPVANGAGVLFDFGCYGANLSTWLMQGQRPTSVRAVTQQIKPDMYPNVDDEATVLLTYPKAQAIIQASWNWPFSRKDMEVYGQTGYVTTLDGTRMRIRLKADKAERTMDAPQTEAAANDPFTYMARLLRGETKPDALTSLENNLIVVEILDAARQSAKTGKAIELK